MQRNIVLLSIPPFIALARLSFYHQSDEASRTEAAQKNDQPQGQQTAPSTLQTQNHASKNSFPKLAAPSATSQADSEIQQAPALSAIEQIRAIKDKTALHEAVLKDHDTFTRYPSDNVRFERAERDPVTMTYQPQERTTLSEDELSSLTAWTDKKYLNQGQSVSIYSRLDEQGQQGLTNKLIGDVFFHERQHMQSLTFSDLDGDGVYSATIPAEATESWPPGIYKGLIISSYKELSESVSFVISPPAIKLTGEYKERINGQGALAFDIEIETMEAARYYVRSSLYSSTNFPIGNAQYSGALGAGRHWIPLRFAGRMFHDAGESGPYEINTVELAIAGVPMLRMPPAPASFYTDSYSLDQFSERTYQEQQELIGTSAP